MSSIPSLDHPGRSVTEEILNFDHAHPTHAQAHIIDKNGKILDVHSSWACKARAEPDGFDQVADHSRRKTGLLDHRGLVWTHASLLRNQFLVYVDYLRFPKMEQFVLNSADT